MSMKRALIITFTTLGAAVPASSLEITVVDKTDKVDFVSACAQNVNWVNDPNVVCQKITKNISDGIKNTENGIYDIISSLNANTEHYESNCRKQTNCFGAISDDFIFSAPEGYRLDMEELAKISVSYKIIGYGFEKLENGYNPKKYGKDISVVVIPQIRHTIKKDGVTLVDTLMTTRLTASKYVNCGAAKKPRKCIKRNKNFAFSSGKTASSWKWPKIDGNSIARALISRENSILFDHACVAYKSSYGNQKPKPTCPLSQWRGGGKEYNHNYRGPVFMTTESNDFSPIEGGRASMNLSAVQLFKATERAAALAQRESDPRYAGDVQRCIVEARNSLAQDRATGSLLGSIASIAGAGELGGALHSLNNASSTYDNLTGKEKDLVDSCLARKGY